MIDLHLPDSQMLRFLMLNCHPKGPVPRSAIWTLHVSSKFFPCHNTVQFFLQYSLVIYISCIVAFQDGAVLNTINNMFYCIQKHSSILYQNIRKCNIILKGFHKVITFKVRKTRQKPVNYQIVEFSCLLLYIDRLIQRYSIITLSGEFFPTILYYYSIKLSRFCMM